VSWCGAGAGSGFNVNVALGYGGEGGYTDADYTYVMHSLVLPLADAFSPDLILVAAGFDCCAGDPVGLSQISPAWFGLATEMLQVYVCAHMLYGNSECVSPNAT
jgi:histone deacetylase 4/5